MATIKLKAGVTCSWGASEAGAQTFGVVKSCRVTKRVKTAMMPDADGDTAAVAIYDETDEVSLNVYMAAAGTPPAMGATLTAGGIASTVLSADKAWESEGFKMLAVTATKWKNIVS